MPESPLEMACYKTHASRLAEKSSMEKQHDVKFANPHNVLAFVFILLCFKFTSNGGQTPNPPTDIDGTF
jgi:hypothetical protein